LPAVGIPPNAVGLAIRLIADVILVTLGDRSLSGVVTNPRLAVRKVRGGTVGARYSVESMSRTPISSAAEASLIDRRLLAGNLR
jgi:hypothetical protein